MLCNVQPGCTHLNCGLENLCVRCAKKYEDSRQLSKEWQNLGVYAMSVESRFCVLSASVSKEKEKGGGGWWYPVLPCLGIQGHCSLQDAATRCQKGGNVLF